VQNPNPNCSPNPLYALSHILNHVLAPYILALVTQPPHLLRPHTSQSAYLDYCTHAYPSRL